MPREIPAPPEDVLACVGSSPIAGAAFDHWATIARKSSAVPGHKRRHRSAKARRKEVKVITEEVMNFLISSDWVLGEAQQLGVEASAGTVRRRFDRIRRQQFPREREFRKFLRASGQNVGDLLFRVRLNLDSEAIQKRVTEGKTDAAAKQQAITEFVKSFRARWRPQTSCLSAFAVSDCGAVRTSL